MSMESKYAGESETTKSRFYFTPAAEIAANINGYRLTANYTCTTQRPTIEMLNPFFSVQNPFSASTGNPDLKNETKHKLALGVSKYIPSLFCSFELSATQSTNAIVRYQTFDQENNTMLYNYANMGPVTTFTGNLFAQWQPFTRLVVKCNVSGGSYRLKWEGASQNDYTMNIFGWIDYYLPRSWRIGGNVMHFKQEPEPFSTVNGITQYSLTLGKSWLQGRLAANLECSTPFRKYVKFRTHTTMSDFSALKINYMRARYVGINVSYTLVKGKKADVKRDTSLKHNDQINGVK